MIHRINLHPAARTDAREAADWYDRNAPGLGRHLLTELHRVLERISRFPLAYPVFKSTIRHATLTRFPYHAFYLASDQVITLVGLMHVRRDRRSIQTHLSERLIPPAK